MYYGKNGTHGCDVYRVAIDSRVVDDLVHELIWSNLCSAELNTTWTKLGHDGYGLFMIWATKDEWASFESGFISEYKKYIKFVD